MAEYRIVTKIDPAGVTQGRAKVTQELRGVQADAAATGAAINKAFDQTGFDRSIGNLIGRLDRLETAMTDVSRTSAAVAASNERVAASNDKVAASAGRTSTQMKGVAGSASQMDAAIRRVLQAVDQEAAEQQRLNALLADAKRLYDAGSISAEQYARVQRLVAGSANETVQATGAQRLGLQQLGFQLGDVATMYSLGAKPAQIFASQIGQITQAVQLMSGGTSRFAAFLGGPWGIALSIGLIALSPFVGKLFEGNDALGDSIKKLQEDARETELNRRAKEAFTRTIEGQIVAQRELNKELEQSIQTQRQMALMTARNAQNSLANLQASRGTLQQQIAEQQAEVDSYNRRIARPSVGDAEALPGIIAMAAKAEERLRDLKKQLGDLNQTIVTAERSVRLSEQPLIQQDVESSLDKRAAATRRYTIELARLNQQLAIGAGRSQQIDTRQADGSFRKESVSGISRQRYEAELRRITGERDAAIKRAQESERRTSDGVSRFRSPGQAIGIAGRELQRQGLRVSENAQFGGVTPGAHQSSHRNAIDVNVGRGVTEANVPDQKRRFDELARRYQARGYRVLWNGQVWEANGNGPTRPIRSGSKHYDHMHVEAPSTIVGKATGASTESQAISEGRREATAAEQQRDFVQGVVDQAATRGVPDGPQTVASQIAKVEADFKRRFDRAMTPEESKKVTGALTDAEARETAQRFDDAYVKPLERLQALQGKSGLDRQVLNAQLEESERLQRALTPVEQQAIDDAIRKGDALQRQADILQGLRGPVEDYRRSMEALTNARDRGDITQGQFDRGVRDLDLNRQNREQQGRLGGGGEVAERMQRMEEDATAERDLAQALREAKIIDEEEFQRRMLELDRNYQNARRDMALGAAQDTFGSLADIAEAGFGKQSAIYKAAFVAEKAVAIARSIIAIQTGVAQALSLPFPGNLLAVATVAAQAASIVSNIQAVSLNLADGGYVRGPGGPREDKVPANLSNGEFVVNAAATARNRALLEAINSGAMTAGTRRATAVAAASPAGRTGGVRVIQHPGVAIEEQENMTTGEIEIIARRVSVKTARDTVKADLARPNSGISKTLSRTTTARRKRP